MTQLRKEDDEEGTVVKRAFPGWAFVWGVILSASISAATFAMTQRDQGREHAAAISQLQLNQAHQISLMQKISDLLDDQRMQSERQTVLLSTIEQRLNRAETKLEGMRR